MNEISFINIVKNFLLLNLYWIIFTVIGLGIFGFGPATYTVYKLIQNKEYNVTTKRFFSIYKEKFFDTNLLTISYIIILAIILYNLELYFIMGEYTNSIWRYLFSALFILIGHSFLIIFPLDLRFSYKNNFQLIRSTFTIAFVFPFKVILYLLSILSIILLYIYFPILLIFTVMPFIYVTNGYVERIDNKMKEIKARKYDT